MSIRSLTYDEKWRVAALRLIAQGYQAEEGEGLITAIFRKEGEPPVYLYMPDAPRAADRTWQPRLLSEKPLVYGVREAAEHLGCSVATIKHAIYNDKRNPLIPDQRIGEMGGLLFTEETLLRWNAGRSGAGAPPGDDYMAQSRLYVTNKSLILSVIRRGIIARTLSLPALFALVRNTERGAGHSDDQLALMARFNLDHLLDLVEDVPRHELIKLVVDKEAVR